MTAAVDLSLAAALREVRSGTLKPPPKLNLVEWADEYRYLSPEASSEPGKWRTDSVPVARGPMLAVSDPKVKQITVMCCTQMMKTELLLNIIGYHVHLDPAPMLLIQPTETSAEAFSKDRVDTMFRDTPAIRDKVGDKRSRDGGNTILHKQFVGGHLTMVGANAPSNLAMRPVRLVLADEIDKYPASAGEEGDPIKLAAERMDTFWNSLLVTVCSPTVAGKSRIELEYEQSDKRIYEVPCPHCHERREMKWRQVQWPEGKPEEAAYFCEVCGCQWSEPDRIRAIGRGEWRATAPFTNHAGFKVSKLASPWRPLSELAVKWEKAAGRPQLVKTFYNTQLAETFKEVGEAPGYKTIFDNNRGEYMRGSVPMGACFLTAGVDVQKDRLEYEVVGWGPGRRSWSVDYRVIDGDTSNEGPDGPWAKLQEVISTETWPHPTGAQLPIRMAAVDSGFRTSFVYDFCKRFSNSRVVPIKGSDSQVMAVGAPRTIDRKKDGKQVWRGLKLYMVGSSFIKRELYDWLVLPRPEEGEPPPGYCTFPQDYEELHFKELTSEQLVMRQARNGSLKELWEPTPNVRNEPLDCRVYARAAATLVGMDRFKPEHWQRMLARYTGGAKPKAAPPAQDAPAAAAEERTAPTPPTEPQRRPRPSSGFWKGRF